MTIINSRTPKMFHIFKNLVISVASYKKKQASKIRYVYLLHKTIVSVLVLSSRKMFLAAKTVLSSRRTKCHVHPKRPGSAVTHFVCPRHGKKRFKKLVQNVATYSMNPVDIKIKYSAI